MTGAQRFILEDVPLVTQAYAGRKVAFFTTNRGISGCRHAGGLR